MSYKIFMIAPTPFFSDRGCHVRIYEEIKSLQEMGHKITLCTYPLGEDVEGIDIRRTLRVPWYKKTEAGPSWHKFYLDELLYWKCRKILKKESFDLIHAHLHEGVFIAGRLRKRFQLPIVADFQGSMTDEVKNHGFAGNQKWILKVFSYFEKRINKTPDLMMLSSQKAADVLHRSFEADPNKMEIISDGVDTQIFSPATHQQKNKVKKELGIPRDHQVVVYLGLLNNYQGIDLLLQMIPKVIQTRPKIHFLIMGFPNVDHYRTICRNHNISSYVTFTGRIPYNEAQSYLACGDIAVSPKLSTTEANGKLLNYMSMGLPTVVFDTDVNRQILGNCGIYALYSNPEDFTGKIIGLLQDEPLRRELSDQLRQKASNEYSWNTIGQKISVLYQKAMKIAVKMILLVCFFLQDSAVQDSLSSAIEVSI